MVFLKATKIPRDDLQEREERKNNVAGEGKKARNFGPPHHAGPHPAGLHFSRYALVPSGPHLQDPPKCPLSHLPPPRIKIITITFIIIKIIIIIIIIIIIRFKIIISIRIGFLFILGLKKHWPK